MATATNGELVATERTVGAEHAPSRSVVGPPRVPLSQTYALPAPIRTFPLPTFYPNNPISLLHLVYAWLKQAISPPPAEPSVVHIGIWDPDTRSVHVVDSASIRALWEQGFFGKGSLSRSEPNWLKRELARRGSPEGKTVSEVRTESRREERRVAKWERAKTELEAIERQRLAEVAAQSAPVEQSSPQVEVNGRPDECKTPVTNEEPLMLPNTVVDVAQSPVTKETKPEAPLFEGPRKQIKANGVANDRSQEFKPPADPTELQALSDASEARVPLSDGSPKQTRPPIGPAELLALPNSLADAVSKLSLIGNVCDGVSPITSTDGHVAETKDANLVNGTAVDKASVLTCNGEQGHAEPIDRNKPIFLPHGLPSPCFTPSKRSAEISSAQNAVEEPQPSKRQKSVRFSPKVKSTTFQHGDPPSPNLLEESLPVITALNEKSSTAAESKLVAPSNQVEVQDKEHFQLSPEEVFFLAFSLGALKVVDRETGAPIRTEQLLSFFRSYSYFPPSANLGPDDPFLVNYAVYHHFRSLGWVPRHGIKFGVDWILYQRGPVFDHSEFGIMVMPAFSRWQDEPHNKPKKAWSWLMGVNRVLSHVLKSLVLVYVDIPPPLEFDDAMQQGGIAAALKNYRIREVMVRRFSVNRNR